MWIGNVCQCYKNSFKRIFICFTITPSELEELLNAVIKAIQVTNTDHVIKRLHLYYDMKLDTFGIIMIVFDSLICCFRSAIYSKLFILYQIETVPVPITDLDEKGNSYAKLQVVQLYFVVNEEIYIS